MALDFTAQATMLREEIAGMERIAERTGVMPNEAAKKLTIDIREAMFHVESIARLMEAAANNDVKLESEDEETLRVSGYKMIEAAREMREDMEMIQQRIPAFGGGS